jgi:hypothetical protein
MKVSYNWLKKYLDVDMTPKKVAELLTSCGPEQKYDYYPNGMPCEHKGCLSHMSHPCECCGRIAGEGDAIIPIGARLFIK